MWPSSSSPRGPPPGRLRECAERGIRNFVLSSGGFAEVDEAGAKIQDELVRIIREKGIQVLGPNTSGHTSTPQAFTSTFFPQGKIRRGRVSYIAQTGNFGTHTLRVHHDRRAFRRGARRGAGEQDRHR